MAAALDIIIQRNETWARGFALSADGAPIDIGDWTFKLQIRPRLDNVSLVAAASIEITNATAGQFDVVIDAERSPLSTYGNPIQDVTLPYDLIAIDSDGLATALLRGDIILTRGVSR